MTNGLTVYRTIFYILDRKFGFLSLYLTANNLTFVSVLVLEYIFSVVFSLSNVLFGNFD